MSFFRFFTLLFLFTSTIVLSQEKIKHVVVSGESVYSIAKKYNVTEAEILEMNPKAKGLLQLEMVLFIPKNSKKKSEEKKIKFTPKGPSHKVEPGESLYTIARKYDTSVEKLRDANPQLESDNLQLGELLALPKGIKKQAEEKLSKAETSKIVKNQSKLQKHVVVSGESFYVIAKKYNISVEELKKANPQVENNKLDIKDVVFIPGTENVEAAEKKQDREEKKKTREEKRKEAEINKTENAVVATTSNDADDTVSLTHEVVPKETKYGISKRYGISITELEKLNPQIANGLEIGQHLIIKAGAKSNEVKSETKVDLPNKDANDVAVVSNETGTETKAEVLPLSADAAMKADFLIAKASENLGVRYRGGGTDRNGFDCSGLMFSTFRNIDLTLPRSSSDMAANSGVKIDRSQAQKGDLIFFATRGRWVGHVGMVTEVLEDEIKFIHSSTSSGVIISSTKEPYYARRFVQINRVLQ
ncbi:LysM peptidoglycan-binding domain-containing protein [Flavobacterium sp. SM15]|uniref:peptidoglycan endopeptidase n=1 Tax=Flavobacterium sp. SM15 TaxID=2908005 RepID=UPI001EDC5119|nr:peptidoglycan endopeptidase [Flavobacterium sp. SM15]MCG2610573.1 LysM peptidoglycan-binding domain-containing protein [Flavobacterium sp. SM15]